MIVGGGSNWCRRRVRQWSNWAIVGGGSEDGQMIVGGGSNDCRRRVGLGGFSTDGQIWRLSAAGRKMVK